VTKKRADLLKTRHIHEFVVPPPPSSPLNALYADKAKLRAKIFELRADGWSYREIAREVGLHWTRVGQILKQAD
jgi:DNA-directed RNA polymerase specialized sigma24 family protein